MATRLLVLALVVSLFVRNNPGEFFARWFRRSWDVLLYILVLVAGVIYSSDKTTATGVLETNFCFLGFSLILARLESFDEVYRNSLLRSFTTGVIVAALICTVYAIYRFSKGEGPDVFYFYEFTNIIQSHPTYTAYHIIFAITFLLVGYSSGLSRFNGKQMIAIITFLFAVLILTGGRTAFVSLLLVVAFFVLRFFTEDKAPNSGYLAILSAVMLICMLLASEYSDRYNTMMQNDSWERFSLWKSAVQASDNILLGVGTGDYKTELNDYYREHGMTQYERGSFNAHNQFLQIYFSNGLLGLVVLVIMFARPLYTSVRRRNAMGVLVFFSFIIYGMTEVFLGRFQGVVFYAMMHQIFVSYYDATERTVVLKA